MGLFVASPRLCCCSFSSPFASLPQDWDGVAASLGPHIVFSPHFSVFYSELKRRFPTPSAISVTARSTLLVTGGGDVTIEGLALDGALDIEVCVQCCDAVACQRDLILRCLQ